MSKVSTYVRKWLCDPKCLSSISHYMALSPFNFQVPNFEMLKNRLQLNILEVRNTIDGCPTSMTNWTEVDPKRRGATSKTSNPACRDGLG